MKNFKNSIINLLREGEIGTAIINISEAIIDGNLKNDLIIIEGRYKRALSKEIRNTETHNNIDREYSKITSDLLNIVNRIDENIYKKISFSEELKIHELEISRLKKENAQLREQLNKNSGLIKGKRLFQYQGKYPIDLEPITDIPSLNKEKFANAIQYFLDDNHYDRLAASDIVYLRQDNLNHYDEILDDDFIDSYNSLIEKYDLYSFIENFDTENKRVFGNYIRITNELGETLKNCHLEILLHNVRNPLKSIIAVQNTENISNRKLFDPSTRFVVEYVRHQGKHLIMAFEGKGKIGYEKEFKNGKIVKATTTPIFDRRYGLVGILCVNIDISTIQQKMKIKNYDFVNAYCKIIDKEEITLRNII